MHAVHVGIGRDHDPVVAQFLDPVEFEEGKGTKELLAFYMGKNTPDRQEFIIGNLRVDVDRQEVA